MKKGLLILVSIVWLIFIYLSQTLSYILEMLSNTDNADQKKEVVMNIGEHITVPLKQPISTIIDLISNNSIIFYVLVGISTVFIIYVLIKQLLDTTDHSSNANHQGYKIAKHGSHGSANFATDNELFSKKHYKKVKENDIKQVVLSSIDKEVLKKIKRKEEIE